MAEPQRLLLPPVGAPTVEVEKNEYHTPKFASFSAKLLGRGDRRFEAETYLASGYGLRLAIESKPQGWTRFDAKARVWQPSRLKGIQVGAEYGTPFLAATQVFDLRPVPRKWLSLARTSDADNRFVSPGDIVVTCSGTVGRATLAHAPHEKTLISHDLLRVETHDAAQRGWIYAYLRAPQTRAMMSGLQYGHMIKHLEVGHLGALPIPSVEPAVAADFSARVEKILDARNEGHRLALEAEARFEEALGLEESEDFKVEDWGENGYSVSAQQLFGGRRRFEGSVHNPGVAAIQQFLAERGKGFSTLNEAGFDVWVPGRYKRIPDENGVDYYDSANILEICPQPAKKFLDCSFGDEFKGRVQGDWLLMPCSGQVYGIIGSVVLAGEFFDNQVVSNHVIRMAPRTEAIIASGYLATVLSHRKFGQPLIKSLAFGSSVPEVTPEEVAAFPVVRLDAETETQIADLAEASSAARSRADVLERALSHDAGVLIDRFIAGTKSETGQFTLKMT